jgi:hypothetical protein
VQYERIARPAGNAQMKLLTVVDFKCVYQKKIAKDTKKNIASSTIFYMEKINSDSPIFSID